MRVGVRSITRTASRFWSARCMVFIKFSPGCREAQPSEKGTGAVRSAADCMRCATIIACDSLAPRSRITNSSPPTRITGSSARTCRMRKRLILTRVLSPIWCPCWSLYDLK